MRDSIYSTGSYEKVHNAYQSSRLLEYTIFEEFDTSLPYFSKQETKHSNVLYQYIVQTTGMH